MKIGLVNNALGGTASSSVLSVSGKGAENVLNKDTGRVHAVAGNMDLMIDDIGGVNAEIVCLFNVYFDDEMTVKLYDIYDNLISQMTFTESDWTGWKRKNILYYPTGVSGDLDKIVITTTGAVSNQYIGYVWAGDWIDFSCLKVTQPFSKSADSITITGSNRPVENQSFRFRTFNITTDNLQDFIDEVRPNMELILDDGFGKGRPFYFDDPPYNGELYFANLDSPNIGFDLIEMRENGSIVHKGQFSAGVREVT